MKDVLSLATETLSSNCIETEDSGQAKILTLNTSDLHLFIRLQSWDENKEHKEFEEFIKNTYGKNLKITFEVIDL